MGTKTISTHRHSTSSLSSFPGKTRPHRTTDGSRDWSTTDGHEWTNSNGRDECRGRGPLTDEQRALTVRYLPMARALARRMVDLLPGEAEEMESTAYLALVEAAQTFDPSINVNFATYARHRVRGALCDLRRLMLFAGWRGDPARQPVFQRLETEDEEQGQVIGITPERPVGTDVEAIEVFEDWLSRLPRTHAAACRLIYIEGMSQEEAAEVVGCSKSTLSRLHHDAITRLTREVRDARAD
jgi:RNA polymerase sigma factor (sigma-70 family)